jgi:subtilase family serine protease
MSSLYPADEGQGVTVGIYELEPYLPSDIATFESCYTPHPTPTITGVSVDGADPTGGAGSGESALDVEMVVGMAPQATIDVYVGRNSGVGPLDVYAAMVNEDAAQVLSTSWGECEADAGTAQIEVEASLFQQAAAQGQSVVAAAGDEGSEDCNIPGFSDNTSLAVDDPASQPWVTGVGGTQLGSRRPRRCGTRASSREPAAAGSRRRGRCRSGSSDPVSRTPSPRSTTRTRGRRRAR